SGLVGDLEDVEEVVGHAPALLGWQLVRPDVHAAVELHGVGVDNLSPEALGEVEREVGLAGGGRPDDRDDLRSPVHWSSGSAGSSWPKGSGPSPGVHVSPATPHPSARTAFFAFFLHRSPRRSM